jgi:hypothetical protein
VSGVTLAGTSDGSDEFFFKVGFGQDAISNLASHLTGAAHDTVSLAKSDFANFTALLADATFVGGAAVITAANHDVLTLEGVTKAMLTAASGDFSFHA